jgi:hypothetical protein
VDAEDHDHAVFDPIDEAVLAEREPEGRAEGDPFEVDGDREP